MRVIDAFAGIGGFSLAADALGWETVAFVERDPDCQFWLGQHWPGVPIYGDICAVRWEDAPPCDVFTAGFPCQPHSVAGKRKASEDDRDLWSECVRAIGVLRPRYAVLENVPGLLTSESGRFFNRVLSDLAALGYVGRYDVLSAAECGAPHKRERVWIVAHPEGERIHGRSEQAGRCRSDRHRHGVGDTERSGRQGYAGRRADGQGGRDGAEGSACASRLQLRHAWADAIPYRGADGTVRLIPARAVADLPSSGRSAGHAEQARRDEPNGSECGQQLHGRQEEVAGAEPALRAVADGIPEGLAGRHTAEEGSSSLWPVTDSEPGRVARLRAVGNAVVPAWVLAGPFQYILDRESAR